MIKKILNKITKLKIKIMKEYNSKMKRYYDGLKRYNDGHRHRFVYTTDYDRRWLRKCYNETLPNAMWAACAFCLVPLDTYQKHQTRLKQR